MDNLAAALLRTGEFPEAEKLTADALRIRRRVYGDKSEEVAASLQTIGQLALGEGGRKAPGGRVPRAAGHPAREVREREPAGRHA